MDKKKKNENSQKFSFISHILESRVTVVLLLLIVISIFVTIGIFIFIDTIK